VLRAPNQGSFGREQRGYFFTGTIKWVRIDGMFCLWRVTQSALDALLDAQRYAVGLLHFPAQKEVKEFPWISAALLVHGLPSAFSLGPPECRASGAPVRRLSTAEDHAASMLATRRTRH
jgi:hypothetical protein